MARTHEEAIAELQANRGSQFDPELVDRLERVCCLRSETGSNAEFGQSAEVARNIGSQIARLVVALDEQNLDRMAVLAERLQSTSERYGVIHIAHKARELQESLATDSSDLFGAMQTATELLDLCRSTQNALFQRPDFATNSQFQ